MDGEPVPDLAAHLGPVEIREWLAAMDVQVVQNQVNSVGIRILDGQMEGHSSERKRRTVGRGEGEVPSRSGFYRAEDIGRAVALVFAVAPCFASRRGRGRRPDIGVQRDRLLIQANHGLLRIVGRS